MKIDLTTTKQGLYKVLSGSSILYGVKKLRLNWLNLRADNDNLKQSNPIFFK